MAYFKIIASILFTLIAALIAYVFIDVGSGSWYAQLIKPDVFFPDWLFGFIWLLMYVPLAGSLSIVWMEPHSASRDNWVRFYFIQLLFNLTFLFFFFRMHTPLMAFINLLFVWLMAMSSIAGGYDHDRKVTYLFIPYTAWIVFVGYWVVKIWILN